MSPNGTTLSVTLLQSTAVSPSPPGCSGGAFSLTAFRKEFAMGGFTSIFSPPSPPPPPPPIVYPVVTQAPATDSASSDSATDSERKARLAAVARNKAGLAGTIATSPRGVLVPASGQQTRKSLLGE
jgi:hypothetical protein